MSRTFDLKKYLRPVIALVLLYFLFKSGLIKTEQLKMTLTNPFLISLGLLLFGLQLLTFSYRWKVIVDLYKPLPFLKAVQLTLTGQFFNLFVPGGIGGDVVKALEMAKNQNLAKATTLTTVAIDRIYGLYFMILFSFSFLATELVGQGSQNSPSIQAQVQKYFTFSLIMLVVATGVLVFIKPLEALATKISEKNGLKLKFKFLRIINTTLTTLADGIAVVSNRKTLFKLFFSSFMAQILSITFIYIVTLQLTSAPPSFFLFFPLACFAFMTSSIPITPGGIGFGQAAFYFIFSPLSPEIANSVTIGISLMQFFNMIYSIPGAYFFLKRSHHKS